MATKKAASTSKKSTAKKAAAKKQTSTKVTTVKAVESRPAVEASTTSKKSFRLNINRRPLVAALIAEFVGTFIFAGTVVATQGQPILVMFALVGVVLGIGILSGAYVNPALTIAAWVTRRIGALRAVGFIIAQVLGAMLAFVVLNAYVGSAAPTGDQLYAGASELFKANPVPVGKEWLVLLAEVLGTAIFGFAVAAATREIKERTAAAFTVGIGLYLGLMIAGSAAAYIGASAILNPAVAVALQVNFFGGIWTTAIYILGTTLGAVIGFALYDLLRNTTREEA